MGVEGLPNQQQERKQREVRFHSSRKEKKARFVQQEKLDMTVEWIVMRVHIRLFDVVVEVGVVVPRVQGFDPVLVALLSRVDVILQKWIAAD
jgi:hypothetical protein